MERTAREIINDLFKQSNDNKLIKGFIFDGRVLQFQSLEGKMIKLSLIKEDRNDN